MAIIKVKGRSDGKKNINYLEGKNGKGHNGHEIRNEIISNIDCSSDLEMTKLMMSENWKKYHRSEIQIRHFIQSFRTDELDPNNPDDVKKCNQLGVELAKKIIGKSHHMAVICTQKDGDSGLLHNHISIDNIDYVTRKGLSHSQTNLNLIMQKNDEVLASHNMVQPAVLTDEYTENLGLVRKIEDSGKYSWKGDLQNRVKIAQSEALDWNDYLQRLKKQGVSVRAFKKSAFDNGKLIDPSKRMKRFTYSFTDKDNKERKCGVSRLGSRFGFEGSEDQFKQNIDEQVRKAEIRVTNVIRSIDVGNVFGLDYGCEQKYPLKTVARGVTDVLNNGKSVSEVYDKCYLYARLGHQAFSVRDQIPTLFNLQRKNIHELSNGSDEDKKRIIKANKEIDKLPIPVGYELNDKEIDNDIENLSETFFNKKRTLDKAIKNEYNKELSRQRVSVYHYGGYQQPQRQVVHSHQQQEDEFEL